VPIEKIEIEDSQGEVSKDNRASHEKQHRSILTARVPSSRRIQALQPLTLSVDTDNLYLFTSDGERI
jgi:hypothetical protein